MCSEAEQTVMLRNPLIQHLFLKDKCKPDQRQYQYHNEGLYCQLSGFAGHWNDRKTGTVRVLIPSTSFVDFATVPPDLMSAFQLIPYQSAEDAVFKALGVE